jgi:hypothetical protein
MGYPNSGSAKEKVSTGITQSRMEAVNNDPFRALENFATSSRRNWVDSWIFRSTGLRVNQP